MNIESWLILGVSAIVLPTVGFVIRELLNQRTKIVTIEVQLKLMDLNCIRHQKWQEDISNKLAHASNNVVRLCQAANVAFEGD